MKIKRITIIVLMLIFSIIGFSACGEKPVSLNVYSVKTEFLYGENFSVGQEFYAIIRYSDDSNKRLTNQSFSYGEDNIARSQDLIIDFSNYKKNEIGQYRIYVKYLHNEEILTDYKVEVKARSGDISKLCIIRSIPSYYDGKEKTFDIYVSEDSGLDIKFSLDGKNYNLSDSPSYVDAGEHKVYYKLSKEGYEDYYGSENIIIMKTQLIITPKEYTIKYGQDFNTKLCICEFKGFIEGDSKFNLKGTPVYTTNYQKGDDCGTYEITMNGYNADNYEIKYSKGILRVEKTENELEVQFKDVEYGKYFNPEIIKNVNGQEINYLYSISGENNFSIKTKPANVGTYDIKCYTKSSKNYNETSIICENISITKADLIVNVNDCILEYGEDFEFANVTNSFEGFKFYDNESTLEYISNVVEYGTNYEKGNPVGEYEIEVVKGYKSNNYSISYNKGKLIVTKANNDLQIVIASSVYNGNVIVPNIIQNPSGENIIYSYKEESTQTLYEGLPKLAGKYIVYVVQNESENYSRLERIFNITIEQKVVELVWNNINFEYSGEPICPSVSVKTTSICGNDEVTVFSKTTSDCINASTNPYTAICYKILNDNYKLPSETTIEFYINKQIVDTPTLPSITYDGEFHSSGLKTNNVYTVVQDCKGLNAGKYTIILKLNDISNYKWKNSQNDTLTFKLEILKAKNILEDFNIASWGYGENPSNPTYTTYGGEIGDIYYQALDENNNPIGDETNDTPTKVGKYKAKGIIYENQNYLRVESDYVTFEIYKMPAKYDILDIFNVAKGSKVKDIVLPEQLIGKWSINEDLEREFTEEGLTYIDAKFIPNERYTEGYYTVESVKIYINVIDELQYINSFNKNAITFNDCTAKANRDIILDYNIDVYKNVATISYSLTQNGEYTTTLPIKATNETIGMHTIWVKVTAPNYAPYFLRFTLTIISEN